MPENVFCKKDSLPSKLIGSAWIDFLRTRIEGRIVGFFGTRFTDKDIIFNSVSDSAGRG
jgi:hypothetical protein